MKFGNEELRINLRATYLENRRNYHKSCRKSERQYWYNQNQNLNDIGTNNPRIFWNRLNMKRKAKSHSFL